jgi:hypothetical protein
MPFKSEKQRRYLWLKEPEVAERWAKEAKKAERSKQRKKSFKRRKGDE